ncbi:uncharacterized protein LOC144360309 [Saccoglossus kowalevskii]
MKRELYIRVIRITGDCAALPVTQNAVLDSCTGATTNTGSGSECTFICSIGYTPITSLMSTCSGITNTWDVNSIICNDINECTSSTPCQNGGTCTNIGGSYTCDCVGTGYSGPTCQTVVNCDTLSDPSNGYKTCTNDGMPTTGTTYNTVCTFYCNTGYTSSGTTSSTCQANGQWNTLNFSCTVCDDGVWGDNCQNACTCISGASCNNVNGECTECSHPECGKIPSPPLLVTTQEDINNKICTICWTEPSSPNGVLIYYRVNYSVHALSPYEGFDGHVAMEDSKGSWLVYGNTCYEYKELQTYSKYVISVQAATYAGESEPSQPPVYCQNSERGEPPISQAPVIVDDKSQTKLLMFHQQFSERNGPISIYESTELNKYEDVNGIPGQAYVAVRMTRNSFQEEVLIGDGKLTECTQNSNLPVKRDIAQYSYEGEVYNGELEPETWYTVFVRAYVDNPNVDGQVFFTSSPFMEPIQTGTTDKSSVRLTTIIAVCVVIIFAVICVVVAFFIIRRRRRKPREKPHPDHQSKAKDDDVYTELTEINMRADTYEQLRINPDGKPLQSRENAQSDYQVVI